MSLLMDALKKAEEAKRAAQGGRASPAESTTTAPASAPAPQNCPTPQSKPEASTMSLELEPLPAVAAESARVMPSLGESSFSESEIAEHTPQSQPSLVSSENEAPARPISPAPTPPASPRSATAAPTVPAATRDDAAAARNLFAAKQAPDRSNFALVVGLLTVISVAAIGGYFWWQLRPKGLAATPMPEVSQRPPVPQAPPPPAVPSAPMATPAPIAQVEPIAPPTAPTPAPLSSAPSSPAFAPARPAASTDDTNTSRHSKSAPAEVRQPAADSPTKSDRADSPVRLTARKAAVNPLAAEAHAALEAGQFALAQQRYQKVLATDPYSTEALNGLAAIAVQNGQTALAESYFQRVLEADPRDAYAQAGLASLRERGPGEPTESRLKLLLAEQPSPALYFALGNVYAREARWADAQQNYFLAFQGDSSNPDTAFNLAVSLDQMRQSKLAAQYYQEALRLAQRRNAAFSVRQAEARLRELTQ